MENFLAKNEEKPCSTCVQPISHIAFCSQKPNFRDPFHHLLGKTHSGKKKYKLFVSVHT